MCIVEYKDFPKVLYYTYPYVMRVLSITSAFYLDFQSFSCIKSTYEQTTRVRHVTPSISNQLELLNCTKNGNTYWAAAHRHKPLLLSMCRVFYL